MASSSSPSSSKYPPLPTESSADEIAQAQQNFARRERASRSWRVFPRSEVNLFKRRSLDLLHSDSDSETSPRPSIDKKPIVSSEVEPNLSFRGTLPRTSTARTGVSQDTGRIAIIDFEEEEEGSSKQKHLFRWVEIYENQRGISLFSTPRYSSQSLLPKDPPPFTLASSDSFYSSNTVFRDKAKGRSDITLEDFPLPDGNWRWASKEWMVDMRDEDVQYDGFQYNWRFRKNKWRSKTGRLNAGAWVRRRRWIRLMERPPITDESDANEATYASMPSQADIPSMGSETVWRGDGRDWFRLQHLMRTLGHDGKRLEAWKSWRDSRGISRDAMRDVLQDHKEDILQFFIFPTSRLEFLSFLSDEQLLSRDDVLRLSDTMPSFVDRVELQKILPPE